MSVMYVILMILRTGAGFGAGVGAGFWTGFWAGVGLLCPHYFEHEYLHCPCMDMYEILTS